MYRQFVAAICGCAPRMWVFCFLACFAPLAGEPPQPRFAPVVPRALRPRLPAGSTVTVAQRPETPYLLAWALRVCVGCMLCMLHTRDRVYKSLLGRNLVVE